MMIPRYRLRSLLTVLITCLCFFNSLKSAEAAITQFYDVHAFKPAVDDTPYLSLYGSQTLKQWRSHLGLQFGYVNKPLQIVGGGAFAGTNRGLVNHVFVADVFGALGLTNWAEVGVLLPIILRNYNIGRTTGVSEDKTSLGDVRLVGKFRLLNNEKYPIGLALVPFFNFPTGDDDHFMGNGHVTGGVTAVADVKVHNRVTIAFNLGTTIRNQIQRDTERVDELFDYGAATNIKILDRLDGIAEIFGTAAFRKFFGNEPDNPLQTTGALRYHWPTTGLSATAGAGAGLIHGVGAPRYRLFASARWTPQPKPKKEKKAKIVEDRIIIFGTIHFEFDKAIIKPISYPILDDVAQVMEENLDIKLVEVGGHCDWRGSDEYNLNLSDRRANAVMKYLTEKGVDPARVAAKGYGEGVPIATNETEEGMAKNRRVEFVIMEREKK